MDIRALLCDLHDEVADLDGRLAGLSSEGWWRETPSPGWSVRHQVIHLAFFDERATLALVNEQKFLAERDCALAEPDLYMESHLELASHLSNEEVRTRWRRAAASLAEAVAAAPAGTRVPWYGPSMSLPSFVSARLMETWAHGQDVADTFGWEREPTSRLRHVAQLAVRARTFSYHAHELPPSDVPVAVELVAPDATQWRWGESADQWIAGDALDFCLVATRRRHVDDTELEVVGPDAHLWMNIAQTFAGPPGDGRRPGQFR